MRLADCRPDGCGRLEVQPPGGSEWGTVCDDGWADSSTRVVCRQLGCSTEGAQAVVGGGGYGMAFGGGNRIWMDDVGCAGSEAALSSCPFSGWGNHNCIQDESVGVCCQGCPAGAGCGGGGAAAGAPSSLAESSSIIKTKREHAAMPPRRVSRGR